MSVCWRRARPVPCARPLLGVSAVPAASKEGCPLRLVKFMTFKFYSPSLSQCIFLSHSLLLLLCVSRAIPGEISGRTHTANILRFLRFFLGFHCFSLPLPLARSTLIATKLMTMWVISISSVCRKASKGDSPPQHTPLPQGIMQISMLTLSRANAAN